jgi:putative endopeptidase
MEGSLVKRFAPLVLLFLAAPALAGPQFGAWGYDLTARAASEKPGDDFFRYANGAWLDRTTIPADKAGYSLRLEMSNLTEQRLHELLEAGAQTADARPIGTPGKVGAFYRAFMDSARIEALGASALTPQLDAVRAAKTRAALAALLGRTNRDFEGSLFGIFIDADVAEPSRYAVYLGQSGLGLPDRDYYLESSFAAKKAAYGAYVERLLTLAGWPEPAARAQDVLAFETAIARASWTKAQQRDPVATYNAMTPAQLAKLAPGFAWGPFLEAADVARLGRVVVGEKSAFPKLAALWAKTPVPTLQAWLAFTIADNAAPFLSTPFVDAHFDLRARTLSGQQAQSVRWKRGVHAVAGGDALSGDRADRFGHMGWAVGEMYTARYFPPEAKAAIASLVDHLKAAYRTRLERLDWMGPETRKRALEKLDTYVIKVGYPDKPRDHSRLMIDATDLIGDVRRAAEADWAFQTARLTGAVDKGDWIMTPQTNDAYNGSLRDIVFPAGILQPPIFDPAADPAINYGAAGGVIGHELTHGFDDQGRKFDARGKLADWWTPADSKAFDARAAMLGKQYDAFEPLPGVHVNGALTMGENIADLGGLSLALEAYRASLGGKPAPVLDGLTGDQRVFLGWAQAWCGKSRDDAIRRVVVSDPHSPRMYRVNGVVRNIDAWYEAFGVQPGDKLYLAPEERVRIW